MVEAKQIGILLFPHVEELDAIGRLGMLEVATASKRPGEAANTDE